MAASLNTRFGMGASVLRTEDNRLLTGAGRYTDDTDVDGALHAYVLRSPFAHAEFTITDTDAAKAAAGVAGVYTADDFSDLNNIVCSTLMPQPDGTMPANRELPLLCRNTVHHVGDAVALVIAESVAQARDAAELIEVDYDALDAVVNTESALDASAPLTFSGAESNLAYTHFMGDEQACRDLFESAAHIAEVKLINNRLVCNYMEPRAIVVEYNEHEDNFTVHVGSQGVHGMRTRLAEIMNLDEAAIHVLTGDVGGGFGTKVFCYREYPLCLAVARKLKRPIRWVSDRSEHFVQDAHGRDNVTTARMAMDADGRFLAIELDIIAAMGAYLHSYGPYIPYLGVTMATGAYDIPVMAVTTRGVYTNTTPTDAYRGAGRPEAAYVIERLVDVCARKMGISVDEVRRRNFIRPEQMPYTTPGGRMYDTGEFAGHMEACQINADWQNFAQRASVAREQGSIRGIGMATYIEACAFAGSEPAYLTLDESGSVELKIGTQSNGQGHATAYAQLAAAELGIDINDIDVQQGDSKALPTGGGTGGSRSVPLGGASVVRAGKTLAARICAVAAQELDCEPDQILLEEGTARLQGGNAFLAIAEVAAKMSAADRQARGEWQQAEATYPNGTHICEVEIDTSTGVTRVVRYTIVDDFGAVVNPLLLQGQIHGGVAQGIGQCLTEHVVYSEDGQLLSATLMDYAIPRADTTPGFHFDTRNVPSTTNEMGIKGAGEAGTIGACPAVMNAVADALFREFGSADIDMPVTPGLMWRRLQQLAQKSA